MAATMKAPRALLPVALIVFLIGGAPAVAQTLSADLQVDRWRDFIVEASRRFAIPEIWLRRVMRAESGGNFMLGGRPVTSPAGAMGLMQLMPDTWAELRRRYGLGLDPYSPRDNILAGAAYLRALYERYGYPNLFAAYNAGPKRLDRSLPSGRPLPAETVGYLARITLADAPEGKAPASVPRAGLFFTLRSGSSPALSSYAFPTSSSGTFVRPAANGLWISLIGAGCNSCAKRPRSIIQSI